MYKRIIGKTCRLLPTNRRFGIELEVCRAPNEDGAPHFDKIHDCSVRGDSLEYVSPILAGDAGLRAVANFCSYAKAMKWETDESCGYHLHVNVKDMHVSARRKLAYAYILTEKFWATHVPAWRTENSYCHEMFINDSPSRVLTEAGFGAVARENNHCSWLNIIPSLDESYGTFEIRLHHGTLDKQAVINWIKIHLWFFKAMQPLSVIDIESSLAEKSADQQRDVLLKLGMNKRLSNYYAAKRNHVPQTYYDEYA